MFHILIDVRRKTRNLELCSGPNVGTNQAKFEKISLSWAIRLGFLRSLVSAIRFEANKINRRREQRPIGSRAVKMLRDLSRTCGGAARSRAACGGSERARQSESIYAQLADMVSRIVAHNRWRDGSGYVLAHSKRPGNRPGKTQRVEGEISIVQSIQLGFSRSLGSWTSNEAKKSTMRSAEWTITARRAMHRLAQMKNRFFVGNLPQNSENTASWTRFLQVQAIKTGRISIIYRQTGDILSFSTNFQQGHCSR